MKIKSINKLNQSNRGNVNAQCNGGENGVSSSKAQRNVGAMASSAWHENSSAWQ